MCKSGIKFLRVKIVLYKKAVKQLEGIEFCIIIIIVLPLSEHCRISVSYYLSACYKQWKSRREHLTVFSMKKRYIIINLIDDQISSFINFLQHTMITNILQRRYNTWCKQKNLTLLFHIGQTDLLPAITRVKVVRFCYYYIKLWPICYHLKPKAT